MDSVEKDKEIIREKVELASKYVIQTRKQLKFTVLIEILLTFLGILVSVFSTTGVSMKILNILNLKEIINNPIYYWVLGIALILIVSIIIVPRIMKKLTSSSTPKEVQLKNEIIKIYKSALERSTVNPTLKIEQVI